MENSSTPANAGGTMKPKLENVFAYGTLLDGAVQKEIIGHAVEGVMARIKDYERTSVCIGDEIHAVIKPKQGSWVTGKVFTVTSDELHKIDLYETTFYSRERRKLADGTEAFVYVPAKRET